MADRMTRRNTDDALTARGAPARLLSAVGLAGRALLALVLSVLILPYALAPVYAPHAPAPFRGATLYNPYADAAPSWLRANFHAHTHAWGGVTSGRDTPEALRDAYAGRGYDVIGVSNYHSITRTPGIEPFVPVYEHGFSIRKTHQIVIGAQRVTQLDFPLYQTRDAKQYLLTRVHQDGALTAVVHPYLRMGYDTAQLATLSGYDLLEMRSHWNDASAWWDAVLTAGNPVWGIGDDDVHDVSKPGETGVVWTMVNATTRSATGVLDALRAGRMYVVAANHPGSAQGPAARLVSLTVRGDTLQATFDRAMASIRVLADRGAVRDSIAGSASLSYVVRADDHYARVVATTDEHTLYLNPVVRADGAPQPWGAPTVRPLASALRRLLAALVWLGAMLLLWRGALRRGGRSRTRSATGALPVANRLAALLLVGAGLAASARAQGSSPFRVGDYAEYDLKFGAIQVGSGALSVHGPDTLRGREVLRLRYEINGGIPFFRVHDVMESWFDVGRMRSLRFTQDLNEGPKHYNRFYDFFPDERIVLERGQPRAPTVSDPLDDAAFIFYVRSLPLEVGQTLSFNRYFRPDANPVTIQVLRRESITVPAGSFNCIVVKPIIRTSGIFSEGGQAELWFSDDSVHQLVQMKAKLAFGSLSLYLRPSRNKR